MKIIIAGGSGFLGQALTHHFLAKHDKVTILGRDKQKIINIFHKNTDAIAQAEFKQQPETILQQFDLVINLAGAGIADKKWSPKRKQELIESRVGPTELIANACAKLSHPPMLFNASGIGIYGFKPATSTLPQPFDEDHALDFGRSTDFVSDLAKKWEQATQLATQKGVRVVNMRFAPVLSKKGGVLKKISRPFLLGLGGPIGTGEQPFPWIALEDLIRAVDFLIYKPEIKGPVNFVAPSCITQKEFAKTLGKVLKRPTVMTTPAFILSSLYGEMAEDLLLNGQCASPKVLLDNGFNFNYQHLETALKNIYKESGD